MFCCPCKRAGQTQAAHAQAEASARHNKEAIIAQLLAHRHTPRSGFHGSIHALPVASEGLPTAAANPTETIHFQASDRTQFTENAKVSIVVKAVLEREAKRMVWRGPDGPWVLQDNAATQLDKICEGLFPSCTGFHQAYTAAAKLWEPVSPGSTARRLVISSAPSLLNTRAIVLTQLAEGSEGAVFNAMFEARDTAVAQRGDIVCGFSSAWQESASRNRNGPSMIRLPASYQFLFYNCQRMLLMAYEYDHNSESKAALDMIIQVFRQDPTVIVQVVVDAEAVLFLGWLHRKIGRKSLKFTLDASSSTATARLNSKGFLYPEPWAIPVLGTGNEHELDYDMQLRSESQASQLGKVLGTASVSLPGYSIAFHTGGGAKFRQNFVTALQLMRDRWGLKKVFVKDMGLADGVGMQGFDLTGDFEKFADVWESKRRSCVIEPFVTYAKVYLPNVRQWRRVVPSVHIRNGEVYRTKLFQIFSTKRDQGSEEVVETTQWAGHVHAPLSYVEQCFEAGGTVLGLNQEQYLRGLCEIAVLAHKVAGLSRGGIDMAYGTISVHGLERAVNAFQDMNIRGNGGDTSRMFGLRPQVRDKCFAMLCIKPKVGQTCALVQAALDRAKQDIPALKGVYLEVIVVVALGWGMFGVTADTPEGAFENAIRLDGYLLRKGLVA